MILSNQVECSKCGDRPYSAHRHDFKWCKCKSVAVDGGMSYLRRVGGIGACKELSIEIPDDHYHKVTSAIVDAQERGCNSLGILCAVAISLRDSGLKIVEEQKND